MNFPPGFASYFRRYNRVGREGQDHGAEMKRAKQVWAVLAFTTLFDTTADAADCAGIVADKERLACYDAAAKGSEALSPQRSMEGRAAYAGTLQRFLLSRGLDFQVMAPETPNSKDKAEKLRRYPQLIVFGPLNNPFVYKLITETEILKDAKAVGFNMVQFYSKYGGGGWWWDISGIALPQCDINKRLCI